MGGGGVVNVVMYPWRDFLDVLWGEKVFSSVGSDDRGVIFPIEGSLMRL